MLEILLLFAAVFLLNVIPAFAPPTGMALTCAGFRYPLYSITLLAFVGASAATLGRLTLGKLSRAIVRQKWMSESTRENIDVLKKGLEKRRKLTFSVCLFYAFSPLPSNFLFVAYGLTSLKWNLIAIPFFLGRFVGYNLWVFADSIAARKIALESTEEQSYLGAYFVLSQLLLLILVYVFTRIDWRAVCTEKKFRWMKARRAIKLGAVGAITPK
jgi:membrane protein DedA with SNARE-associated domain